MIIARYITKEVLWTFMSITFILLMVALSNRFATFLAKAATGEFPVGLVFRLVWLYIPELLSYLIPLSLFLAILFAFGRLHAESEMAVLSACGVSWSYISKITLFIAFMIMLIVTWLTMSLVPTITSYREKTMSEGEALGVIQSMLPGRFQTYGDGSLVFYIEDIDTKTKGLKGIFIAEQPGALNNPQALWTMITAKEAEVLKEPETEDFYLVLKEGYRYQGKPGQANYNIVKFNEYGRALQQEAEPVSSDILRAKQSSDLASSNSLEDLAELQWRLSIPLSVPILALLAIPLARVSPRHGRFAKFLPAILSYIVYYNLFTLSKRWVAGGILPSFIGVWWTHFIFLGIALFLLAKESGWLRAHEKKWRV